MLVVSPAEPQLFGDPDGVYAKVIRKSVNATGDAVCTMEIQIHRFVLVDFNTHCILARNSASSRAIPLEKRLKHAENCAWPVKWGSEQPGMMQGPPLEGASLQDAMEMYGDVYDFTMNRMTEYVKTHPLVDGEPSRLHKSVASRLLEPFLFHTIVVTASSFQNFFDLRDHPAAQQEMQVVGALMRQAFDAAPAVFLQRGEWHLPYVYDAELDDIRGSGFDAREISSARCARVSMLTQDGKRDLIKDVELYQRLTSDRPMHSSPLEHPCTPQTSNAQWVEILDPDNGDEVVGKRLLPKMGKFIGWQQFRHLIEARQNLVSYR